ncbi:hypothetical protein HMPREF1493_0172 [Atopobium sp. ICM42b]|nr:hypothetical protein HMPREF1493_0172 [Atopobium sp. ICM42b]
MRGELLPRGPDRALLARRPRRGRRRVRDGGQRRVRRDGRGLGGAPLVQQRLHRQGRGGRRGERARARLRGHRRRARGQDHRARRGRQPRCRREGGVTCARTTAFQVILGSSGSLRPPSRTEPYINIRDTTLKTVDYLLSFIRRPKIHARASGFPRSGSASRGIAGFDWG